MFKQTLRTRQFRTIDTQTCIAQDTHFLVHALEWSGSWLLFYLRGWWGNQVDESRLSRICQTYFQTLNVSPKCWYQYESLLAEVLASEHQ